jgi:plasmid maintenance system antidote protein VapI
VTVTTAPTYPRVRADIVRDVLRRHERNQSWLARHLGVHRAHLSRILSGEFPTTDRVRVRMCEVLNLPESVLFEV